MKWLIYILIIFFGIGRFYSCRKTTSVESPNFPPETMIANVPAEGDTLFPLVKLYWNGGDADGFIAAYEYRYISYHLTKGDSEVFNWVRTDKTSQTITFSSSDEINLQKFEVRAVDNEGAVDPTPAQKHFYTPRTIPPQVTILKPMVDDQYFVLEQTTDWWHGIQLIFTGTDADGVIKSYAYSVDKKPFIETQDTMLFIGPDQFATPLAGEHTIRVIAKDNTDLISLDTAEVKFSMIKPTFNKTLLILDETNENNWPAGISATDDSVDLFYRELFALEDDNQWDEWDYHEQGPPLREILGQYKVLVWHGDDRPTLGPHALSENQELFKDYASVGGNFVLSGWRMIKSFAWRSSLPYSFPEEDFVHKYLHIKRIDESILGSNFTHAVGNSGFSTLHVDSSKLANVFPFYGALSQINLIVEQGAFTKSIYAYGTTENSKFPQYRGQVCGLLYYGTTFRSVVLGFPLFFIEKEDAKKAAEEILQSLKIK